MDPNSWYTCRSHDTGIMSVLLWLTTVCLHVVMQVNLDHNPQQSHAYHLCHPHSNCFDCNIHGGIIYILNDFSVSRSASLNISEEKTTTKTHRKLIPKQEKPSLPEATEYYISFFTI